MDLKTGEAFVEGSGDPAVRVIDIKKSVFADNDIDADNLWSELKEKGVFLLNLMSAPGSGKTTTLIRTIDILRQKIGVGLQGIDVYSVGGLKEDGKLIYPDIYQYSTELKKMIKLQKRLLKGSE